MQDHAHFRALKKNGELDCSGEGSAEALRLETPPGVAAYEPGGGELALLPSLRRQSQERVGRVGVRLQKT